MAAEFGDKHWLKDRLNVRPPIVFRSGAGEPVFVEAEERTEPSPPLFVTPAGGGGSPGLRWRRKPLAWMTTAFAGTATLLLWSLLNDRERCAGDARGDILLGRGDLGVLATCVASFTTVACAEEAALLADGPEAPGSECRVFRTLGDGDTAGGCHATVVRGDLPRADLLGAP